MARYAEVIGNNVVNVVLWDGSTEFTTAGSLVVIGPEDVCGPGFTYENGAFIAPPPPPAEEV